MRTDCLELVFLIHIQHLVAEVNCQIIYVWEKSNELISVPKIMNYVLWFGTLKIMIMK